MITLVTIVHIIVALFLIVIVLLQTGKGASIGAVFGGGSSQTLFGSRGAGNFLTKMTTAAAIIFMLTSLGISIMSSRLNVSTIAPRENPNLKGKVNTENPKTDETSKKEGNRETKKTPIKESKTKTENKSDLKEPPKVDNITVDTEENK